MKKTVALYCFFFGIIGILFGQAAWSYKGEKQGIKGYTRVADKAIELKFTTQSPGTLSAFVGVLKDVPHHPQWMTGIKNSLLLKEIENPLEIYYHAVVPFPWPMDNRDAVMCGKITQDFNTKNLSVKLRPIPTYMPLKAEHVRLTTFQMDVSLKPQNATNVSVECIMKIGEADGIPLWLVDWLVSERLFEVIHNLCESAQKTPYKYMTFPNIQN